jgi:hypothetical protein
MTATAPGLSTVLHALDENLVHLSLHNTTDRLLFYVRALVVPVNGELPAEVFQAADTDVIPAQHRWRWIDLASLDPGAAIRTEPIRLPENNWAAVRYVTLQPIEGAHKPHHPVLSNAVPLRQA